MFIDAICPLDNFNIPANSFVSTTGIVVTLRGAGIKIRKYIKGLGWVGRIASRGNLDSVVGVTLDFKNNQVIFDVNSNANKVVIGDLAELLKELFTPTTISDSAHNALTVDKIVHVLSQLSYTSLLLSTNILEADKSQFISWVNEVTANLPEASIHELVAALQKTAPKPKYKWILNTSGVKTTDGGNLAM